MTYACKQQFWKRRFASVFRLFAGVIDRVEQDDQLSISRYSTDSIRCLAYFQPKGTDQVIAIVRTR
ncbi:MULTISPECIES: hypothetical protein [Pseudomonas]|uniref:hypothetical protein n=1 Tax=Pseudomonas TaxID=286 RepID=UPI0015AEA664|nr:hypothetical protein [Pseudomonas sp. RU47]